MKRVALLVNPFSGTGKKLEIIKAVDTLNKSGKCSIDVFKTERAGHGPELAIECIAKKYDVIAAAGGDGTVHELLPALLNCGLPLLIVPSGSGNGLARHLHIPMDPWRSLQLILEGHVKLIDTATVNSVPFVLTAGCGFDSLVTMKMKGSIKRGFKRYASLVASNLNELREQTFFIQSDAFTGEKKGFLITVANAAQFGNNTYIAPGALIDDGLLNVTILKRFPLVAAPLIACRLFTGTIYSSRYAESFAVKSITITQSSDHFQADGESFTGARELSIQIVPGSLKVLTP